MIKGDTRFNIVDTPGHADFGGEVERVMGMVDGVVVLIDAYEGPMTQTKFVLSKALQAGLRPIVVLNKVDREASRIAEVESDILDLLIELDASDDQLEYPVLYASAKNGWVVNDYEAGDEQTSVEPLFQAILDHVPPPPEPKGEMDGKDGRFQLLITMMSYDTYMGRLLTGRMVGGPIKVGDVIHGLALDGSVVEQVFTLDLLFPLCRFFSALSALFSFPSPFLPSVFPSFVFSSMQFGVADPSLRFCPRMRSLTYKFISELTSFGL
jgi:GTP-binding protein